MKLLCVFTALLATPALSFMPAPRWTGRLKPAMMAGEAADLTGKDRLKRFLEDAAFLGPIRFISIGDGAILEAVGSFEDMQYNNLPKGEYATFASEDRTFECHINLDKVAQVQMVEAQAQKGDHINYITRFLGPDGKVMLSTMLHRDPKEGYEEAGIEWFNKLRGVFGEMQQIQ